jgi:hypothetical protein
MSKTTNPLILKSLYAIMLAPVQSKQSFSQLFKSVFYPRRSRYGRITSFINIIDFVLPNASKILSRRISKNNHFPWNNTQPPSLIGSGVGAAVFKYNNLALRIYRKSYGSGLKTAISTVKLYQQHYHKISTWYQNKHNITLPMHFLVVHGPPLFQPTAASIQPYLPNSRKDLFKDFNQDQLITQAQTHPTFNQALSFFIEKTLNAYHQENACPDLLGDDNVVIVYRDGLPHLHILDIGILDLDDIQVKAPQRIPQIQAVIQNLETLHLALKKGPNTQTQPTTPSQPIAPQSMTNIFSAHVQAYAARYYPQLDPETTRIRLIKKEDRMTSRLFYFDISDKTQGKTVLIKVSHPKPQNNIVNHLKKPRLFPATDPSDMPSLEHQALSTIQSYFQDVDSAKISTIKVLGFLHDKNAIVMEAVQLPNLRTRYLEDALRFSGKQKQPVTLTFINAGRWLRCFHAIALKDHVQDRHTHSNDFLKNITVLTEYLIKTTHRKQYLSNLRTRIITLANQHLPKHFPLGLGHGDFAARNILTNKQGAVIVIDTFAKWNVPIYEDIGYFINNIRSSSYQIATRGLVYSAQRIASYERAFLSGYFQRTPIPYPQIKLFEILALLDKWADTVGRANEGPRSKILNSVMLKFNDLHYKKRLNQLIKEIQENS